MKTKRLLLNLYTALATTTLWILSSSGIHAQTQPTPQSKNEKFV